jgi:hypothetical protein
MFFRFIYGGSLFQHLLRLYLLSIIMAFCASFFPARHSNSELSNGQETKMTLRERVMESAVFAVILTPLGAWKLSIQRAKFLSEHPEEEI